MRTKREKRTGIYRITCLISGCVYIGSSFDLFDRIREYDFKSFSGVNKNLKESFNFYGRENFILEIMCEFDNNISKNELWIYEDALILLYIDRLGEEKIFNSFCNDKQKWMSKEYRDNLVLKHSGRKITEETRNKISRNNQNLGKFGILNSLSIKVNQLTLDGVFIKQWDSIADIGRFFNKNKSHKSHISAVCRGKRNQTLGFKWEYAD